MKSILMVLFISISLIGCTKKQEVKVETKVEEPPKSDKNKDNINLYFTAIKRDYDSADNVCFDFTSQIFLIHLNKTDENQKDFWGWNMITDYKFEKFENNTVSFRNGVWSNITADVTGLTCSN